MGLSHIDLITDKDAICTIDPQTRVITNNTLKNVLLQYDHNSERVGFSIDRYIEGHDMLACDRIAVLYANKDNSGIYIVDDAALSTTEEDKVNFTWLISRAATKNVGSLVFGINFRCVDSANAVTYNWSTQPCSMYSIIEGVSASEGITYEEYNDLLEQLRGQLDVSVSDGSVTSSKLADNSVTSSKLAEHSVTALKLNTEAVTYTKIKNYAIKQQIPSLSDKTLAAMQEVWESYYTHHDEFIYGSITNSDTTKKYATALDMSDTCSTKHIDCTTIVELVLLGVPYEYSRYNGLDKNVIGAAGYCFNPWLADITADNWLTCRHSFNLATRFRELGLGFFPAEDYSNLQPGDIIFMAVSDDESEKTSATESDRWLGINHAEIFAGFTRNTVPNDNYSEYRYMTTFGVRDGDTVGTLRARNMSQELASTIKYVGRPSMVSMTSISIEPIADVIGSAQSLSYTPTTALDATDFYTIIVDYDVETVGGYVRLMASGYTMPNMTGELATAETLGSKRAVFVTNLYNVNESVTNPSEATTVAVAMTDDTAGSISRMQIYRGFGSNTTVSAVGRDVSGESFTIDEDNVTAADGAEVFNDYMNNVATGNYSHAEGSGTKAIGDMSHVEGLTTVASGDYSHAEGWDTFASGSWSHAEGNSTNASGEASHAEGSSTTASADASHAEGTGTIAASMYQHAQGKYNVEDTEGKYAFIIGNGTSPAARSNALAVDWEGKIYTNNSTTAFDPTTSMNLAVPENTIPANANANDYTTPGRYGSTNASYSTGTNFPQKTYHFVLIVMKIAFSGNLGVQILIAGNGDIYTRGFNLSLTDPFDGSTWKKITTTDLS